MVKGTSKNKLHFKSIEPRKSNILPLALPPEPFLWLPWILAGQSGDVLAASPFLSQAFLAF